MAHPLNLTAPSHGGAPTGITLTPQEDDWGYSDVDRLGDEGRLDMAEIYFDYYFNDERRWDNPEGWDSEDEYWHPGLMGPTDHYTEEDWEDYEMEQEYHRYAET